MEAGVSLKQWPLKLPILNRIKDFVQKRAGAILASMAWLGIPVSTTHAISGAIMGVGATTRLSAVRWGIGKRLVYAWIITIPASALVAGLILFIIRSIF